MASQQVFENIQNPEMASVTDFHIKSTDGEMFFCAKSQFFVKSNYFKGLFSENWEERVEKNWESGLPSFVLRAIIKWVYVAEKIDEATRDQCLKIMEAANFYGLLVEMLRAYEEEVGKELTEETVIDTLIAAEKSNALELKEKCLSFVARKDIEISKSRHGPEELSWDLLLEIANRSVLVYFCSLFGCGNTQYLRILF